MLDSGNSGIVRRAGSRDIPRPIREAQILDVAGRLFAARGYHAAARDEIAAQADVTKPLIYGYFGNPRHFRRQSRQSGHEGAALVAG